MSRQNFNGKTTYFKLLGLFCRHYDKVNSFMVKTTTKKKQTTNKQHYFGC